MELIIKINLDNDTFIDDNLSGEVEYCLTRVVELIQDGDEDGVLTDSNGDTVGKFIIK